MTFPDVRWGSEASRLREPLIRFSATKTGSWLIRSMTPLDRRLMRRTTGRYTMLGPIAAPTLLLTTIGARSGLARTTPLLYGRQTVAGRERLVVAGSNFGQQHHPAWTANLIANPRATVTMGGTDIRVHAELLHGEEAEAAYQVMVEVVRTYREYRSRTDREIRVFALTANS